MTEQVLELDDRQLEQLAQLLLGAAWADEELHGLETAAIKKILAGLADDGKIPSVVVDHFVSFDPETFAVERAVKKLGVAGEGRQAVLSLVARVTDADFTHDFAEGEYVVRVANALGLGEDDYRDLIVEEIDVVSK